MKMSRCTLVLLSTLAFGGCGPSAELFEDAGPRDAGGGDAGQHLDDAGAADAGRAEDSGADAGAYDGGAYDGGAGDGGAGDGGAADGGGEGDAGPACAADEHECDGECVPEGRACGVPIPDACTATAECGPAGECIDARCVCAEGHRACAAGCCPVSHGSSTLTLEDLEAQAVQLVFGPDGTAYILLQVEVVPFPDTEHELRLYTRAPTPGAAIVPTSFAVPSSPYSERYSFAVRSDSTVFVAVAPTVGERSWVVLHQWTPRATSSEQIGMAYGHQAGISLTVDRDDTVWVTWSSSSSGGLSAYSLAADGVARTLPQHSVGRIVGQTDVEQDPASGAVYAFWGSRTRGSFEGGVVTLSEHPNLSPRCLADDAAFDSLGRHWSVYTTYSPTETHFCRDGTAYPRSDAFVRGSLPRAIARARLAIDGEDTAFVAFYEVDAYDAHWLASSDGERWSRGVLPLRYGLPSGSLEPGDAFVDAARRPDGPVSFVVVPRYSSMGAMTLVDFE